MAKQNLIEMWSQVKGSFEDVQNRIRQALSLYISLSDDCYVSLEATFPDVLVYLVDTYGFRGEGRKYFQADWSEDENGKITITNPVEVKPETVVVTISETAKLMQQIKPGLKPFPEIVSTDTTLKLEEKDGKQVYVGKVDIAQKADELNENNRLYPAAVLEAAINEVNERIKNFGPLHMDSIHRVKDGANFREITRTVALIYSVTYHPDTKTVSLDEIRLVGTRDGKDIMAVLDEGAKLQVSQRGAGFSEIVKDEATGKTYEKVTELHIDGWDFTAGGDASVTDAQFTYRVITEEKEMGKTANPDFVTKDQVGGIVDEKLTKFKGELLPEIQTGMVETLKKVGLITEDTEGTTATPAEVVPAVTGTEAGATIPKTDVKPDENLTKLEAEYRDKAKLLDEKTKAASDMFDSLKQKADLDTLKVLTNEVVTEILATDAYKHFDGDAKKIITEAVYPEALLGKVKADDKVAIKAEVEKVIILEATKVDRLIASVRLTETGYPLRGTGGAGITSITINETVPGMEFIEKLTEAAFDKIKNKVKWIMPKEHPAMATLAEIQSRFYKDNWNTFKRLSEAAEDVTQADIGVRVATMAAAAIPVIWRTITALQVVNAGVMTSRLEDVPIESWLPVEVSDIADAMAAVEVGESGTLPTVGMTSTNVPMIAVLRKLRSLITEEARLTAQGSPINPLATTIAGMAMDLSQRMDRLMWWLQIVKAQAYGVTQVTGAFEQLTLKDGATYTFESANKPLWIQYEWVKAYDGTGNPTGCKLVKLFGTTSGNAYQAVVVEEHGGDHTALVYGAAEDYTINWPDGSITLTAAGLAKCADGTPEAKFSYTTNGKPWSLIPPTGVQLWDHLINLRQSIGQVKVMIGNRHYNPAYLAMSLENEDRIASSPMMTNSLGSADNVINALSRVMTFAGLEPIRSSAIPQGWIVVGERNAEIYRVQKAFAVRGPITDSTTGDDYYHGTSSEALDIPVAGKFGVVGIQDLITLL